MRGFLGVLLDLDLSLQFPFLRVEIARGTALGKAELLQIGRLPELAARDRILLVGDAAGLADPVTAEGISAAWASGELAGQALLDAELRSPDAEAAYQQLIDATLAPEQRAAAHLARLLYRYPRARSWVLKRAGAKLVDVVADVFTGHRTYRSLVARPASYLSLGRSLLGPG